LYWFPNHIHSFVALHPIEAVNNIRSVTDVKYSEGLLTFNYTHPQNYRNASDLLVATHRRQYNQEMGKSEAPVSFTFEHILSVLDIRIMYYEELAYTNQNNRIEITEIALDGVNVSGSYNVRPDDLTSSNARSGTDAHKVSGWSKLTSGSISFKGVATGHNNQYGKSPTFNRVFQNNDALIVLPKDEGDVNLTMTFRLFVNGTYAADHTLSTTLENAKWEAGQKIIYDLQVSVGEILQGGCTFENWNLIDELTETITDSSSDHDAGKGDLNDNGWSNIEHGWQ
ncbi:MAG: fimbrillin family protein, partial [Muribaculaceae bacterium]|nr:fimbrillin family protein [Muribaculaceae bacterium]